MEWTCCVGGLESNKNYAVQVRARNDAGVSKWSSNSEYLPTAKPAASPKPDAGAGSPGGGGMLGRLSGSFGGSLRGSVSDGSHVVVDEDEAARQEAAAMKAQAGLNIKIRTFLGGIPIGSGGSGSTSERVYDPAEMIQFANTEGLHSLEPEEIYKRFVDRKVENEEAESSRRSQALAALKPPAPSRPIAVHGVLDATVDNVTVDWVLAIPAVSSSSGGEQQQEDKVYRAWQDCATVSEATDRLSATEFEIDCGKGQVASINVLPSAQTQVPLLCGFMRFCAILCRFLWCFTLFSCSK